MPSAAKPWTAASPSPSRSAARHTSATSPVWSAAATSSSCWASAGSVRMRRMKLSVTCSEACPDGADSKPPASCVSVRSRGNSRSASGFPWASAMSRSKTSSSSGPANAEPKSARASRWPSGPTCSSGSLSSARPTSRVAKRRAMRSARSRRATKVRTCSDPRSSQCASSTTHNSGCCSAASDNRLRMASPTRYGLGAGPPRRPKAISTASRWGSGSPSRNSKSGVQSCWSAANGSSISPSTPTARATRNEEACAIAYSSNDDLPIPGSPWTTRTPPYPSCAALISRSIASRSR